MKALVRSRYGGPEVLSVKDVPEPVLREDEALIRVRAVSLNAADVDLLKGVAVARIAAPFRPANRILGSDVAGRVVKALQASIGPQKPRGEAPWKFGFDYAVTVEFEINEIFEPGIYTINNDPDVFFVVRDTAKRYPITVLVPTNTMNAYSCYGGRGLYGCPVPGSRHGPKDTRVSFLRPIKDDNVEWGWDPMGMAYPAELPRSISQRLLTRGFLVRM